MSINKSPAARRQAEASLTLHGWEPHTRSMKKEDYHIGKGMDGKLFARIEWYEGVIEDIKPCAWSDLKSGLFWCLWSYIQTRRLL